MGDVSAALVNIEQAHRQLRRAQRQANPHQKGRLDPLILRVDRLARHIETELETLRVAGRTQPW